MQSSMLEEKIKQTIEELLGLMTIPYSSISIVESELPGYVTFSIDSPETSLLIGREGANLHALSYLMRKMTEELVREHNPEYRFFLDVGGYEVSRIRRVKDRARTMAERARMFERDVEMEPMDAYDRMIVHATLGEESDVTTESEGERGGRRVVIKYKKILS